MDDELIKEPSQKLWSIWLLVIGASLISVSFLIASFWESLGLNENGTIWLALAVMIGFGFNLSGLIIGFFEGKKNKIKAMVGIIGNTVLVLFVVFVVIYSLFME